MTDLDLHAAGQPFTFTWDLDALARGAWRFTGLAKVINAVRLHGKAQVACSVTPNGYRDKAVEHIRDAFTHAATADETFEVVASGTDQDWSNFIVTVTRTAPAAAS